MHPSSSSPNAPPCVAAVTNSPSGAGRHPGPPVVLLHGWGSHAARFADFVAPLRAAGYAVIGIDAPAHGSSPGRFSDLPRFRDSLAEVLRAHEPIHAVIGHSLGGGAVLTVLAETADHHPKKVCLFGVPSDMDYILESFAMMLGLKSPALANLRARFRRDSVGRRARYRWRPRRPGCGYPSSWFTTKRTMSRQSPRVRRWQRPYREPRCGEPGASDTAARCATRKRFSASSIF